MALQPIYIDEIQGTQIQFFTGNRVYQANCAPYINQFPEVLDYFFKVRRDETIIFIDLEAPCFYFSEDQAMTIPIYEVMSLD